MHKPRSEALGEGLFELRGHRVRMLYLFRPGERIVVLDGMVKKQDKIPVDMLRRIRSFQRDLEDRERARRREP